MERRIGTLMMIGFIAAFVTVSTLERDALARAGGGKSFGNKGSRSYSRPVAPPAQPSPAQQMQPRQSPMTPPPYQQPQPAGGGFFRSMAGGIVGGMLGGMLFRSLGFGGGGWGGGFGGSGIGLFEIILLVGIGYLIYRFVRGRKEESVPGGGMYGQGSFGQSSSPGYQSPSYTPYQAPVAPPPQVEDLDTGIGHIRQMDPLFSEERFCDQVMDIFFKIQGAWMNRDLAPASGLLTAEMKRNFQGDIDNLLREKRVNRLENIAVRNVEIVEAWQEQGQDYITALIYANLLDYTTDDATGQVVAGSKTDPVKFEEYWTFTRQVGNNPWQLSAIEQK